ncbi:MAG: pilus assembly protein PilM, partial [Bacillota bacterium]|nr:pilus assembly protein PilM [Bacillota bacterium]
MPPPAEVPPPAEAPAPAEVPAAAEVSAAAEMPPPADVLPDAGTEGPGLGATLTVIRRASPSLVNVSTGIDVGSYETKLVQVAHTRYGPVLVGFGSARTPPEAVSDGRIADAGAVSRTLRVLLQGARVRPKSVITCATGKAVTLRVLPFPRMRPDELVKVLSQHGEQYVPIAREKAAFAFSILDNPDRSDQMEVLVAATSREVPDLMERTLRAARLRMAALDVDVLAAFRGLRMAGCLDHADRTKLVVLLDF